MELNIDEKLLVKWRMVILIDYVKRKWCLNFNRSFKLNY